MSKPWKSQTGGWAGQRARPRPSRRRRGGRGGRLGFGADQLRPALIGAVLLGLVHAWAPAPDALSAQLMNKAAQWWEAAGPSRPILEAGGGAAPSPFAGRSAAVPASSPGGVRVIDGDTFHYRGEKIRIADIDTPEVKGRCAQETRLAARATRRMEELLARGPFELERVGRDEDRYGRKLRVVTRNGRSLGDQLVAEGLARTWSGRREPWC